MRRGPSARPPVSLGAGVILAAAVCLGLSYTVSPLTVLFALAVPLLFWWTGRGLDGLERRRVFGVLAFAVLVRVAVIALVLLLTDPARQHYNALVPDAHAAIARTWWIRNLWLGVTIGPWYTDATYNQYGASPYWYVLAAIQMVVGASPYGLSFVSTTAFLAGAGVLYRLARESYGPTVALTGFVVLVFWPTTLAWSVATLKESMQFGLTAVLFACTVRMLRTRTWAARVTALAGAVAAIVALDGLRSGALAIAGTGVAAGIALRVVTLRRTLALATAVGLALAAAAMLSRPATQDRVMTLLRESADRQLGHVASFGYGYKVLDQRFYSEGRSAIASMNGPEALRYLARATVAFFVVPAPWQLTSNAGLGLLPQQLIWYALVVFSVPGIIAGLRRDPLVTWIFVAYIAAGIAVIAPNSGNIGTLVRHRDAVMPALVWLSALGWLSTVTRVSHRREARFGDAFGGPLHTRVV